MADTSGPEKYAPPDRRPPEKASGDNTTANDMEARTNREFVARDVSFRLQQPSNFLPQEPSGAANDLTHENLDGLVRRVSGVSIEEIDRVIRDLGKVRDMLRTEGERVSREVAAYTSLSHAAALAMKVIADSINKWKDGLDKSDRHLVS